MLIKIYKQDYNLKKKKKIFYQHSQIEILLNFSNFLPQHFNFLVFMMNTLNKQLYFTLNILQRNSVIYNSIHSQSINLAIINITFRIHIEDLVSFRQAVYYFEMDKPFFF